MLRDSFHALQSEKLRGGRNPFCELLRPVSPTIAKCETMNILFPFLATEASNGLGPMAMHLLPSYLSSPCFAGQGVGSQIWDCTRSTRAEFSPRLWCLTSLPARWSRVSLAQLVVHLALVSSRDGFIDFRRWIMCSGRGARLHTPAAFAARKQASKVQVSSSGVGGCENKTFFFDGWAPFFCDWCVPSSNL